MEAASCVAEVTRSRSLSPLGSEFNDFLFAPVCEDGDETPLSVISALARLDFDPWEEAAALARLPSETAAQRLACLLAKLPYGPSPRPDSRTIADRLVPLLPRSANPDMPSRTIFVRTGSPNRSQLVAAACMICWVAVMMVFIFMTSR